MKMLQCDILIIGGGIVGLSLAKGLEQLGVSYLLVDENLTSVRQTFRPLALSKISIAILKYLQVWSEICFKTTLIQQIHVSVESAWGHLLLNKKQHEHLGVVLNLNDLQNTLWAQLLSKESCIHAQFLDYDSNTQTVLLQEASEQFQVQAQIIIAADGALSAVRQACRLPVDLSPEQEAVIGTLQLKHPHEGKAFERFAHLGPLALLPWNTHEMAIVWSLSPHQVAKFKKENFAALPEMIKKQLANRMGDILRITGMRSSPLRQIFMPIQSFQNILFLGNAAHTLHPVAGQGFNLSLRDVATFLEVLQSYGFRQEVLPIYLMRRKKDQAFTLQLTRFLATDFNRIPKAVRGMSLMILGEHLGLKQTFENYAQGLGYPLPEFIYPYLEENDE